MKHTRFLWLLIAVLVAARVAYYFAQPDMSTDHLSQMAMAQNFMDGNGFSFKYLDVQQKIYYKAHIQWPPLYPLVLSVVSFITANTLLSSLIIQLLVLLFLVIIWKKIFNLFKDLVAEEAYFYFISLLIISTSIFNNINTILIVTILILSLSIYFLFAYFFFEESKKLNLFLSSLFASLLFWTHYSYFLVTFYPAVVFFIFFYIDKSKTYFFASLNSFFTSLVFTSGVLIYNYLTSGFINYMDNPYIWDAGFFPEHLLLTDPFFVNAFLKSAYLIDYLFNKNYQGILTLIFQIISIGIFIIIAILLLRLRKNKSISLKKTFLLFIPFFVIIFLTISFLLYFTLHYHEIPRPGWTHIGDARYLSSVYLSVIAVAVLLVFVKSDYLNNKIAKVFKVILVCLVVINFSINIYITNKEFGKYSYKRDNYMVPEKDLQELFDNIKFELSKGNQPVFIDNELTVRSFRISQYAGAAVINAKEVTNINEFPTNIVFFFIVPKQEHLRIEDKVLLDWSKKFNSNEAGLVYKNIKLYKVENLKL